MCRKKARPEAKREQVLECARKRCAVCDHTMWMDYVNYRVVTTLEGMEGLALRIRRCSNPECVRYHQPYRPEAEGRWVLPNHEFGLDVIALVGALRYREHRSVSEIHAELSRRKVPIAERTVINLLDRYDELLALSLTDDRRLQRLLAAQGRVILAIDGLAPDVGHEVLWVLRDCISGEVLLACSLLSATEDDLAGLIRRVKKALPCAIAGVISDGQRSVRNAVAAELSGVPHQLCQFHYLREAARPIFEADRHAKKELKKLVRGVRPIERKVEGREDAQAEAVRGYCAAVRSSLTDDGRAPLDASGLQLHERLTAITGSLTKVAEKGGSPESCAS
jgi:hypothetical protein